jgi:hypothetical protein
LKSYRRSRDRPTPWSPLLELVRREDLADHPRVVHFGGNLAAAAGVQEASMRRPLLIAVAIAAVAAPAASAKEGAQAHLLAPLPVHSKVGSLITIRWSVDVPGAHGTRVPFGATGMFVRLVGPGGAATAATARQYEPPYHVGIRVPAGGIRSIRFGLAGTSCGPSGCRPSPAYFPLR